LRAELSSLGAHPEFDYVVVGGGLAGCVVAARLSEDPDVQVVLLEAGPWSDDPLIARPSGWPFLLDGPLDWGYRTEPQRHLNGRELAWPRGRVVGGSGAINAMVWIRGAASDFEAWTEWGGAEWGAAAMLPWFDRIESNGAVRVADQYQPHPFALAFVEAAQAYGLPASADFNGPSQEGVGLYRISRDGPTRFHTAEGYLRPALDRPNLTVLAGTPARAIRVDGGSAGNYRAVAVDVAGASIAVRGEVVLCAGTVASPQLLLLSGIGPADALREHGIDVRVDLPGVGENLHDHVQVSVSYPTTGHEPLADESNLGEAGGFVASREGLPAPDIQLSFAPMENLNNAEALGSGFTIGPAVTRPRSRGRLTLGSADPAAPPRLDPNYLAEAEDVATLVEGVRIARGIAATKPLAGLRSDYPDAAGTGHTEPTSDDLEAFVRANAQTQFHPVGTCRFGTDPLAVVDPRLNVHGIAGLRVADSSVIPKMITGNIQAATIVIAERAAEFIRADRGAVGG
jgi:choline dehydrogenase